ncbi:MAG: hypothetical protein SF002_16230 [Alphaproteobacteria bacterium]|nr:hypothetical protein [Alphaproteobacteria bacterium]
MIDSKHQSMRMNEINRKLALSITGELMTPLRRLRWNECERSRSFQNSKPSSDDCCHFVPIGLLQG